MSWLVKGYVQRIGHNTNGGPDVYSESAQYVADVQACVKDAIGQGCSEIFIVKTKSLAEDGTE